MAVATPTRTKQAGVVDTLDAMLRSIGSTKQAAEANTEAGGYQGATEHQSKNEDDHTEDAREGARSSENERDVKEDQGDPGVDGKDVNASAAKSALSLPGNQDDVQMDIGVTSKATGEDSENETDRAKPGKEDASSGKTGPQGRGETSHPARTDNDEIDGHKWSSAIKSLLGHIKLASQSGNDALAAISVEADDTIKEKAAAAKSAMGGSCDTTKTKPKPVDNKEAVAAQSAGAAAVGGAVAGTDKQAQAAQVVDDLHKTILAAYQAADKTAEYLAGLAEGQAEKRSEESEGYEEEHGNDSDDAPPDKGHHPAADGGGGGGGDGGAPAGGEEAALIAALTGGGGGMGGGMGGGDPLGGSMGGGLGGGGGMGGMGGPPPPAGGEIGPQELQMLAAALQEAGIDPAALEAGAAAKAAAQLRSKQASGQSIRTEWRPKTAAEANRYQAILNYVKECVRTA